jgi:hypothetical protein
LPDDQELGGLAVLGEARACGRRPRARRLCSQASTHSIWTPRLASLDRLITDTNRIIIIIITIIIIIITRVLFVPDICSPERLAGRSITPDTTSPSPRERARARARPSALTPSFASRR